MKAIFISIFTFIGFTSSYCADSHDQEIKDEMRKVNETFAGKAKEDIVSRFGKPSDTQGDWPDAVWHYSLPVSPYEVSRYRGFSVSFIGGKVRGIELSITETLFESKSGLIGKFPGVVGEFARQAQILAGLEVFRTAEKLTKDDEARMLGETVKRISIARQRGENVRLPIDCDYAHLLLEVAKRHGIQLNVVEENGSKSIDLKASRTDFETALSKLARGEK